MIRGGDKERKVGFLGKGRRPESLFYFSTGIAFSYTCSWIQRPLLGNLRVPLFPYLKHPFRFQFEIKDLSMSIVSITLVLH